MSGDPGDSRAAKPMSRFYDLWVVPTIVAYCVWSYFFCGMIAISRTVFCTWTDNDYTEQKYDMVMSWFRWIISPLTLPITMVRQMDGFYWDVPAAYYQIPLELTRDVVISFIFMFPIFCVVRIVRYRRRRRRAGSCARCGQTLMAPGAACQVCERVEASPLVPDAVEVSITRPELAPRSSERWSFAWWRSVVATAIFAHCVSIYLWTSLGNMASMIALYVTNFPMPPILSYALLATSFVLSWARGPLTQFTERYERLQGILADPHHTTPQLIGVAFVAACDLANHLFVAVVVFVYARRRLSGRVL